MADSIQIQILDGLYKALKKQIDYYSRDDLNLSNVPKDERVAILAELGTIHTRLSAFANSDMLLTLNDIETIKKDYEALISNIPSGSTYDDTEIKQKITALESFFTTNNSKLNNLLSISSNSLLIDAVANTINPLLAPIYKLFRESANGINTNVTAVVSGDSTNSISYAKYQVYYKKQFGKLGVAYFDNSYQGQTAFDWLNNIDNNTLQQAINATAGEGENTIMIYSFGINDFGTYGESGTKQNIKLGIQAYLLAKPKAKIILLRPNRTASNTLDTALGNIYAQLSVELNLFLVDAYAITVNKWGNPLYYYDTTHPNMWGARAVMNNTFAKIVPLELMYKLTLQEEDGTNIAWSDYCLKSNLQLGYWSTTTGVYNSNSTWVSMEEVSVEGGQVLVCSHLGNKANFVYMDSANNFLQAYNPPPANTITLTVPVGAASLRINVSNQAEAYFALNDVPTLHKQTIDANIYCNLRTINAQQILPNRILTTRNGILIDDYGKIGTIGQTLTIDSNNKMKWS